MNPDQTRIFQRPIQLYQLHADLLERSSTAVSLEEGLKDKLLQRHLTRLQRAVSTFRGQIVTQTPLGLLATFDSAEQAALSACDMQRSCLAIPLPSGLALHLRVGIHAVRSAPAGNTGLEDTDGLIATSLAHMLTDKGVLLSSDVYQDLPPEFQPCATRLEQAGSLLAVHTLAWQSPTLTARPTKLPEPLANLPAVEKKVLLTLRHGAHLMKFGDENAIVKVGRDMSNDVVVRNPEASRNHCRIVFEEGNCYVLDLSTNGTYVTTRLGETAIVNRTKKRLQGRGWLTFGDPYQQSAINCVEFEVKPAV